MKVHTSIFAVFCRQFHENPPKPGILAFFMISKFQNYPATLEFVIFGISPANFAVFISTFYFTHLRQ